MLLRLLCALGCAGALSAQVSVLSGPAKFVTGDRVLVGLERASARVTLNGRDVSGRFRPSPRGGVVALLEGLKPGENTLAAAGRKLTLVNHSKGPAFSGPRQTPFVCQTAAAGLGEPLDADCTAKTQVAWFYRSTDPAPSGRPPAVKAADTPPGFKPYDPNAPRPADMAQTTTTEGETVDFIVRREVGTINRAIYQIAFLHDPRQPLPDPWTKARGWNGRLVYSFGGGCRAGYHQGLIGGGLDAGSLGKGFATAAASLNVLGNNCNDVLSAETLMMVKEHFAKTYGPPRYTIGTGGSGGSIQQHLIAQNYPGLLDGVIPAASYPDVATVGGPVVDCAILGHALDGAREAWTDAQKTAVSGYATWGTCQSWIKSYAPVWLQPTACDGSVPKSLVYNASTNPKGARCTLQDNQVNIYGRDPRTGFARSPFDNTGVQYGLAAFNAGAISAEQFVELNERAGGVGIDGEFTAARSVADPQALRIAYGAGRVNAAAGSIPTLPILDVRQYVDPKGDIHDSLRSYSMRARLQRVRGDLGNHVILINPRGVQPVLVMDQWLAAGKKPADLADACWTAEGEKIVEPLVYHGSGRCAQLYPAHADPRIVAGAPLANDVLKCALKPLAPGDYQRPLSAEQVARLRKVFPQGVCDYGRPGVGQGVKPEAWKTY
jgi:hypothetical protein